LTIIILFTKMIKKISKKKIKQKKKKKIWKENKEYDEIFKNIYI